MFPLCPTIEHVTATTQTSYRRLYAAIHPPTRHRTLIEL